MGEKIYEIVYIDKFSDNQQATLARQKLQGLFHLSDKQVQYLNSGDPVVVKRDIPMAIAQKFKRAIEGVGATCWIQEMANGEPHYERRQEKRRQTMDRRDQYRSSSILPDRRAALGRRSDHSRIQDDRRQPEEPFGENATLPQGDRRVTIAIT